MFVNGLCQANLEIKRSRPADVNPRDVKLNSTNEWERFQSRFHSTALKLVFKLNRHERGEYRANLTLLAENFSTASPVSRRDNYHSVFHFGDSCAKALIPDVCNSFHDSSLKLL